MKKLTFFPVNWILVFKHSWIKKHFQPLTLEWLESAVSKLF